MVEIQIIQSALPWGGAAAVIFAAAKLVSALGHAIAEVTLARRGASLPPEPQRPKLRNERREVRDE